MNISPILLISGSYNILNTEINQAGCYMCSGLYSTESFRLPIYIGSSQDIGHRIEDEHIAQLDNHNHINNPFQSSWNQHKEKEGFVWWLLENCQEEKLLEIEQKYLDIYRPFADEYGGFNLSHNASSPMKGRKKSKESIEKWRKTFKSTMDNGHIHGNKGKKASKETKEKMSKSFTGDKNSFYGKHHSEQTKEILRNQRLGKENKDIQGEKHPNYNHTVYHFINKETKEEFIGTVFNFCKKFNLYKSNTINVTKRKVKSANGWTLFDNSNEFIKYKIKDTTLYKFKNLETGEIFEGTKRDFCNKYKLESGNVAALVKKRYKTTQGWIFVS